MPKRLKSGICKQSQIESPEFMAWASRFPLVRPEVARDHPYLDRKLWEWCFICQALTERGLLAPGRKGLGFAVGQEPLPSLFASYGCEVVATDQSPEAAAVSGGNWVQTGQHAANLDVLYKAGHCPAELFRQRVQFREVDMNAIPADLRQGQFDFTWSACSFEHLGTLDAGRRFLDAMMDCLKPGGVAVHTTEFNCSSDTDTVEQGWYVLYRKRDMLEVQRDLRRRGHRIAIDFDTGRGWADKAVDRPPYQFKPHVKLELSGYVATSIGLIIEKAGPVRLPEWVKRPLRRARRLWRAAPVPPAVRRLVAAARGRAA